VIVIANTMARPRNAALGSRKAGGFLVELTHVKAAPISVVHIF